MTDETPKTNMTEEHPDYPGLTRAEVEQAKKRAADKVAKARKTEALDRIADQEEENLRLALGETERTLKELEHLSPANREMVDITLNLAPQMDALRIDGVVYRNRGTYPVTRAKATDMLKMQYEGWHHESVRLGQDSYAFYSQQALQNRSVVTRGGLLSSVVIGPSGNVIAGNAPRGTH